jgi:hypothetical protein
LLFPHRWGLRDQATGRFGFSVIPFAGIILRGAGQVVRTGNGRKNNPFRYVLPGRSLSDEGPLLPPLAEELGMSEQELAKVELAHLQKLLLRQRRQDEAAGE